MALAGPPPLMLPLMSVSPTTHPDLHDLNKNPICNLFPFLLFFICFCFFLGFLRVGVVVQLTASVEGRWQLHLVSDLILGKSDVIVPRGI